MKNGSHRYDINRTVSQDMNANIKHITCNTQHLSNIEAEFMKKVGNTEAELKKCVAYAKKRVLQNALCAITSLNDDSLNSASLLYSVKISFVILFLFIGPT